ncbi:MAG: hypothetical protein JXA00_01915 [Candidatus Thermoplasmatota archaeon]|nr:hypothetical protein [Candidatus Thermoplasmatota archaeon]
MKNLSNVKLLLKAVVVLAVAVAFIMPVAAVVPESNPEKLPSTGPNTVGMSSEWIEQATGFPDPSRGINYIHCVDENIVWAAAYDGTNPSAACQEFTKTINGGTTWTPGFIGGADGLSLSMIFALDENTAWAPMYAAAGGTQGIYKTLNGGSSWTRQESANYNLVGSFPNCVHFWDENIGWCMGDPVDGYYEIYTTTDGGALWTRVPSSDIPVPLSGEFGVVGYYDVIGDNIWFGTNMGRVYKSEDRGLHWTVAQTPLPAYLRPMFKDEDNGLVIDLNAAATAMLAETSDGGATWQQITFSGTCYDSDICYLPGTDNMYISTGAASGASGASYSLDGGHTWILYDEMFDVQMMALDFVEGKIGWAGSFNDDEFTGGIFKHVPSGNPEPAFTIGVEGGKGFTVSVTNVGEAEATNVDCAITIEGGLMVKPRDFSGNQATLGIGENLTVVGAPKGIGLGFITPVPSIIITVTCAENVTATRTVPAKIFFSRVTLQ